MTMRRLLIKVVVGVVSFAVLLFVALFLVVYKPGPIYATFTFDDGTIDHFNVAAPTLEKYGYRGLFCVVVNRIGTPGYMTWEQVKELERRGHAVASHSLTHQNLKNLYLTGNLDEVRNEIAESKRILEGQLGHAIKYFCLPYNACCEGVFGIIRSCDMVPVSCTRINLGGAPALPRVEIGEWLDRLSCAHVYSDFVMMFHVTSSGKGYAAYGDHGETFERIVADVKKHSVGNRYVVVGYQIHDWNVIDPSAWNERILNKMRKIVLNWCLR